MNLTGTEEVDLSTGESELIEVNDVLTAPFVNEQDCVKIVGVGEVWNAFAAFVDFLHEVNREGYFFGGFFVKFIYLHKD